MTSIVTNRKGDAVQNPPFITALLNDPRAGWLWFFLRIWLGWQWVEAGLEKVTGAGWVVTGESLKSYWVRAVAIPATGRPPISYDWYRSFLQFLIDNQSYVWFGKLIAYGELLVGIGLIVGAFTGIAAFFGALMNWNFMLAGSASTNPVLFTVAILLIVAWKVAGYIGADYFILRYVGTPWKGVAPRKLTGQRVPAGEAAPAD